MDATAERPRARRFEQRALPPPFQLTDRDLAILAHVARHRFVSSEHLVALDGGSEQNLLRCLRVLFDHGYLDRPHAQLAHLPITGPRPMVYRHVLQIMFARSPHPDKACHGVASGKRLEFGVARSPVT